MPTNCAIAPLHGSYPFIAIAVLLCPTLALADAPPTPAPSPRVLHFPEDRSLGILKLGGSDYVPGSSLGPATGDVTIPAGKQVSLTLTDPTPEDLAALTGLGPSDLYGLKIRDKNLTDDDLKHISHLTGLNWLALAGPIGPPHRIKPCPFTGAGLQHLKGMDQLEILSIKSCRLTDENLHHVTALPSLELLYLQFSPDVKGPGLQHLRKCPKLRQLAFYYVPVDDEALAHLAAVNQLKKLSLYYTEATENGLCHLKNLDDLTELSLSGLQLTDTGWQYITSFTGLEKLHCDCPDLSDDSLLFLEQLPNLRDVSLTFHRLNEAKVKAIQAIPRLEILDLRLKQLEDKDTKWLKELPTLTNFSAAAQWLTDKGLANLGQLKSLQRLELRDMPVTDQGLSHLSGMTSLNYLDLEGTKVTDAGVAHLARLTSLQVLSLNKTQVTGAGLSHIKHLSLRNLYLNHSPIENAAVEDLVGIPSLRSLSIQRTYIDEPHFEKLKRALPECRVFWRTPPVRTNAPAPPITIEALIQAPADAVATLEALRDNVVVLEFWATWCGPCRAAMPHLNELIEHFNGQPVRFISITQEVEGLVEDFLTDHTLKSWVAIDATGATTKAYKIGPIPRCVVIDPKGIVRARCHPNDLKRETIQALLDQ